MTDTIDFQLEENRWAAQMACDEVNAALGGMANYWKLDEVRLNENSSLYALALRILRTETPPVDPDLIRAREIAAKYYDEIRAFTVAEHTRKGEADLCSHVQIAILALKEGRKP